MPSSEILIVKLGARGDVVRTTGLLAPLRRRHAPCRISWLTSRASRPLLAGLPVDRVAVVEARPPRWLRETEFDLVVCMDEARAAVDAAAAARAKRRVGAAPAPGGRISYTRDSDAVFGMSLLAPDRERADARKRANRLSYQRLWARALGLKAKDADLRPPLRRAAPGERHAAIVAVHAGSGIRWPSKRLPTATAAAIVRGLADAGFKPVLVNGPGEGRRNAAIVRLAGAGRVSPALGLGALGRWLSRCRAVVSTDSLPMHLALAAGVPCVALFGPTSRAEIATFGPAAKVVPPVPCRCFYRPRCDGAPCLGTVDAREVVARVRELA